MSRSHAQFIAIFTAAFAVHFLSVGASALAEGVFWPREGAFLGLAETAGWYLNGGLFAPLIWANLAPYALERQRQAGDVRRLLIAAAVGAAAVNIVFFATILSDQHSSFNSLAVGTTWERPFLTIIPNAIQSTLFDVAFFLFIALQAESVLQLSKLPAQVRLTANAGLVRISWVILPCVLGHLTTVAPPFIGRSTSSAVPILGAFAFAALLELALFAATLARARQHIRSQ